jgi:hypothetical protein
MSKKNKVSGIPGADPTLPRVPLKLGGNTYYLCFSWNALAKAEELTGMNLLRCFDLSNVNARSLRALIFAAMLKHQPEITLEEVGDLLGIADSQAAFDALLKSWAESMPKPEKPEEGEENPPQPAA